MDLAESKLRQSYLDKIHAKHFDAILLSPPCSSFSRAPFANHRGPRPVRCYDANRQGAGQGYPWRRLRGLRLGGGYAGGAGRSYFSCF